MDSIMESEVAAEPLEPALAVLEFKPKTAFEIFKMITLVDEAIINMDVTECVDLFEAGKVKIDNYKMLRDRMVSIRDELKADENKYKYARQQMDRQIEGLDAQLIYALESNEFEQFAGNRNKVKLKHSEYVALKLSEPSDFHAIHLPDVIRVKREWNKAEIKKILQSEQSGYHKDKIAEIASIEKRPSIRWSVIKDVDDFRPLPEPISDEKIQRIEENF